VAGRARARRGKAQQLREVPIVRTHNHEARGNLQMEMIDLRFELKEHISREEWEEIFRDS
jgi:hypothetical protein